MWPRSVRATLAERPRVLPGDERIPQAIDTLTHGVTIRRPPRDVWPWIVQMGAGSRAGGYSYDWLDNGCASWGLHPHCVAAVSRRIALDRQGRVEVDGVVSNLGGGCPDLRFMVGMRRVKTSMATVFDGVSCMGVRNMMRVEAKGVMDPADGMVAATRVELDD